MENFIFSINVTFPIFLVMVLGYFLKQIGMLDEHFVTVANKFNFKVTLPFMLFRDISSVDIKGCFDLKYVLFCAIASSVCFWGSNPLGKGIPSTFRANRMRVLSTMSPCSPACSYHLFAISFTLHFLNLVSKNRRLFKFLIFNGTGKVFF